MAAPLGVKLLSELRDRLEAILSIESGNSYIDSTQQLDDINEGYQKTAYAYDWPSLLHRVGIAKVANLDRYGLPATFRKARTVRLDNTVLTPVELEFLKRTPRSYYIDQQQHDIILREIPTSASTPYTLSNAETAANAVTIELDTVSGLSQHDEIWVDSASGTDEFTMVSSVSTANTRIVARLDSNKSASDIIYRQNDIIDILFYRRVTLLSAAGDTTLLPGGVDFIMLHYSAAKAYERLEMFDEAEKHRAIWERELAEAWRASDVSSTGEVAEFSIG